ncbi:MAG: LysE family transporter [Anaerolineae bacterium]|nr:LysE family transporter [Anaerolineae bacterium]
MLNVTAVLSFVLATTFSPGPNNLSSASMGVLHGYKKTLRYMAGIATGFFLIMLLCSWVSMTLLDAYPALETVLRFIGAGYILWLAYHTLRANYTFGEDDRTLLGFTNGLVLQILNPKAIIYGLTLYSTLLAPATGNSAYQMLSALLLAVVAFCATSTWALFGSLIRAQLKQPKIRRAVSLVLALLLIYTAFELSGLL